MEMHTGRGIATLPMQSNQVMTGGGGQYVLQVPIDNSATISEVFAANPHIRPTFNPYTQRSIYKPVSNPYQCKSVKSVH
jgi:hypothetical protein